MLHASWACSFPVSLSTKRTRPVQGSDTHTAQGLLGHTALVHGSWYSQPLGPRPLHTLPPAGIIYTTLIHGSWYSRVLVFTASGSRPSHTHIPSIAFRHLPPEGCRKPVLGICHTLCHLQATLINNHSVLFYVLFLQIRADNVCTKQQ